MQFFALLFIIFALAQSQSIDLPSCPVATPLQVIAAATLADPIATLVSDDFTVNWIWSLTQTLTQTPSYQFGSCSSVPAPDTSTASGSCDLAQSAEISWSQLTSACGWTNTSNAGILSFNGSVFIFGNETFLDARNTSVTRTVSYEFPLSVDFPENLIVSSNLTAFAPVLVDGSLLQQGYSILTGIGTINFQTVVQFPWSIQLTGVVANNTNLVSFVNGTETIATVLGGLSTQNWILSITPANGVCVLDGGYNISAELVCTLANQSNCPVLAVPPTFNFFLDITSQSFCPTTSVTVPLIGVLNVYNDSAYLTERSNFVQNADSFFQLTVTSPSATITSIDIDQVTISATSNVINNAGTPTNTLIIFDAVNGWIASTLPANTAALGTNGVQRFNLRLTDDLLIIPADSAVDVTISVRTSISFLGNKKRASLYTFQINSKTKSYETSLTYESAATTTAPPPETGSTSVTSPTFLFALLLVALMSF